MSDILDELWKRLTDKSLLLDLEFLRSEVQESTLIDSLNKCRIAIDSVDNVPTTHGTPDYLVIPCHNSYERKIVHAIAEAFDLKHGRTGSWDPTAKLHFDEQCRCRYCWEAIGHKYKLNGVWLSRNGEYWTRKDIVHRKQHLVATQKLERDSR